MRAKWTGPRRWKRPTISVGGVGHRCWVEEVVGGDSHVDVPAFVFVGFEAGRECDRREACSYVFVDQRDLEHPLERPDGGAGVGDWAVAVGVEGCQSFPEL